MKLTIRLLSILLCLAFALSLCACSCNGSKKETEETFETLVSPLWDYATYLEDVELGHGKTTLNFTQRIDQGYVNFTIHTDKETVGDALLEQDLIVGTQSEYGLYVTEVNGVTAEYVEGKSYWAFYVDDKLSNDSVDKIKIEEGKKYAFIYTKE